MFTLELTPDGLTGLLDFAADRSAIATLTPRAIDALASLLIRTELDAPDAPADRPYCAPLDATK